MSSEQFKKIQAQLQYELFQLFDRILRKQRWFAANTYGSTHE